MSEVFENLSPIADKIEPSFFEANWWWIVLILLVAAFVLGIVVSKLNSRPAPSAFEIAKLRLNACKNESDDKQYAALLSNAVRDYISAMFAIPAPEQTTEEFLESAAKSEKLSAEFSEKIEAILKLADLAKFAGAQFDTSQREKMFALALDFIESDNALRTTKKQ